jgi:histidinol-phosphatase (PHP family)
MNLIADIHMHTRFSVDGQNSIHDMCCAAIDRGLKIVCFTEHLDCCQTDHGYGFFRIEPYFAAIAEARRKFGPRLKILSGIEFSEPARYTSERDIYFVREFDFILGSVHQVDDTFMSGGSLVEKYGVDGVYERYFRLVLDNVALGGFDSLAHMDFPKRYIPKYNKIEFLEDILRAMVKNNVALEINTSPLRKGMNETSPARDTLKAYADMGGTRVTVGSDAHFSSDIAAGFDYVSTILKEIPALTPGYFEGRKFREL